jgi:hypothetical protein
MRSDEYSGDRDLGRFWREVEPRREPVRRRFFLPSVLVLVILSIPWYWPAGTTGRMFGGLPVWMWIALVCTAAVAVLTSWVALREWDDDED